MSMLDQTHIINIERMAVFTRDHWNVGRDRDAKFSEYESGCPHTGCMDDVRIPMAEAAVAIAPIRQGGGTRLKILEAMALGTPVVATPKGAEGLDVADGEHLVLADDPQRFAAAVLRLLTDDGLATCLRGTARQLVEQRYGWNAMGRRFVAVVEETVVHRRVAA